MEATPADGIPLTGQGMDVFMNATVDRDALMSSSLGEFTLTLQHSIGSLYLLGSALLVFFLQFGLLQRHLSHMWAQPSKMLAPLAGRRHPSFHFTMMACAGTLAWWAVGAPFAYGAGGATSNWLVGLRGWLLATQNMPCGAPHRMLSPLCSNARYLYEWAVALFVCAIVTFNLRGRCSLASLIALAAFVTGGIYPVAVHWIWSEEGLLSAFYYAGNSWGNYNHGMMDLGGSGVIHVLAGACALCAVAFIRRTDTGTEDAPACDTEGAPCCSSEIKKCGPKKSESGDLPNAALMQVLESGYHSRVELSTLTLWLGWFGLTVGGVYAQTGNAEAAARAAVHTFLAGAAGGFVTLLAGLPALNLNKCALDAGSGSDSMVCCNTVRMISSGVMAGLVAVSAGAGVYKPYAAAIVGAAGGFVCCLMEMGAIFVPARFPKVREAVRDCNDAVAVHLLPGLLGLVAAGLAATKAYTSQIMPEGFKHGALYGGGGVLLLTNIVGGCILLLWALVSSFVVCIILRKMEDWSVLATERISGFFPLGGEGGSIAEEAAAPGDNSAATAPRAQPADLESCTTAPIMV